MNVLSGANDHDKLAELANKNYKDQAVWFLNAFWDELPGSKEGEVLYNHVQHIAELDSIKKRKETLLTNYKLIDSLKSFMKL